MAKKESFVCTGNISTYQCGRIPIKYNTMSSNLDGINLSYLLLNGCISLIDIFTSHYLLPMDSNTLAYNLYGLNPIFIFELMEFPYFRVDITISIPYIYTHILQIPCYVSYFFCENIYQYINRSYLEPTNSFLMSVFNTGGWYVEQLIDFMVWYLLSLCNIISRFHWKLCPLYNETHREIASYH